MKKSGGSSFLGTYIMYGLVAIAFFLLVIFMVRGSLVEHYTTSQWKRADIHTNATDGQLVVMQKGSGTSAKQKVTISTGTPSNADQKVESIGKYLKKIGDEIDSVTDSNKNTKCSAINTMLTNAHRAIGEVMRLKDARDSNLRKKQSEKLNNLTNRYNRINTAAKQKCGNTITASIITISK